MTESPPVDHGTRRRFALVFRILRWGIALVLLLLIALAGMNLYWAAPQGLETGIPSPGGWDYTGIIHVHSQYSDGSGTFEMLADAARDARADFILTADHNTVEPLVEGKEGWYEKILIACGIEVTFDGGHYVYFADREMTRSFDFSAPRRPLETPRDDEVVILAHPVEGNHPITDWQLPGADGLELFNGNVEWRDDLGYEIPTALPWYRFFRSPLNYLVDRPSQTLEKWDQMLQNRHLIGIGAADAHARISIADKHFLAFPGYARSFRFVRTHVVMSRPMSEDYDEARADLLSALAQGRAYVELGDFSDPRGFFFAMRGPSGELAYSGTVAQTGSLELEVRIPLMSNARVIVYHDGLPLVESRRPQIVAPVQRPGVYRVEVFIERTRFPWFDQHPYPWIISNAIRVLKPE